MRNFLGSAHTYKYFFLTENIDLGVAQYHRVKAGNRLAMMLTEQIIFPGILIGNGKKTSRLIHNRTDDCAGCLAHDLMPYIQKLALSM